MGSIGEDDTCHFDCVMPQENARIFANSIQCLAKSGKELILEATSDIATKASTLTLRTLNDSKTAFTVFTFNASFFERFHLAPDKETGNAYISAKFPLKASLCAFRSIRSVERFQVRYVWICCW